MTHEGEELTKTTQAAFVPCKEYRVQWVSLNHSSVIITPDRTIPPPITNDHPMDSPKKM